MGGFSYISSDQASAVSNTTKRFIILSSQDSEPVLQLHLEFFLHLNAEEVNLIVKHY